MVVDRGRRCFGRRRPLTRHEHAPSPFPEPAFSEIAARTSAMFVHQAQNAFADLE